MLPFLGDVDPFDIQLSTKEEAVETELRKELSSGNAKLSNWIRAFSKASTATCHAAFITFWLFKFIFGSHPCYVVKLVYFRLTIKISARVSLPLAPLFLGHLYIQLDILQSDERQVGFYHIVTTPVHSTIL